VLGLLGGSYGAAMSLTDPAMKEKIPLLEVRTVLTSLRPTIGAASGIVAYIVLASRIISIDGLDEDAMLPFSFVAGFSERLIVGKLEQFDSSRPKT
jgi:hypothetical protein